jgi:transposase
MAAPCDFPGCAVWISTALSPRRSWDEGEFKRMGRVDMRLHLLGAFAKKLAKEDIVLVEATGNASSVVAVIAPHVKQVVIADPKQVRIRRRRFAGR